MHTTKVLGISAAMIVTGLAVVSILGTVRAAPVQQTEANPDPILMSFERELNHQPVPVAKARRDSIDQDLLYREVNSVNWTRDQEKSGKDLTVNQREPGEK